MGNLLDPEPVRIGQIRFWNVGRDIGMGPFLVVRIGKLDYVEGEIPPLIDGFATVLYASGDMYQHLLIGMDEDSDLIV